MSDLYCVFGNPIAHSRSPAIHGSFARLTEQDMCYEARLAPIDGFEVAARSFFDKGGRGCNVTVPFKVNAYEFADVKHERALACGAANTLWKDASGKINADNTDGVGLVRDLTQNLKVELTGARILLLGAGGAARGAVLPLLRANPTSVTIANRTHDKALSLAQFFYKHFQTNDGITSPIKARPLEELADRHYDVVINATAAGLAAQSLDLPDGLLHSGSVAYDMVYGKNTLFMVWAATQCDRVFDGLGMLVEQAAESFGIWRGFRPSTRETLAQMRQLVTFEAMQARGEIPASAVITHNG